MMSFMRLQKLAREQGTQVSASLLWAQWDWARLIVICNRVRIHVIVMLICLLLYAWWWPSIRVETCSISKNRCWYNSVYFVLNTEYCCVDWIHFMYIVLMLNEWMNVQGMGLLGPCTATYSDLLCLPFWLSPQQSCPNATLSTTNPTDQTRDRTQAAAVGSQRLTAWAMARAAQPLSSVHHVCCS
jgi:hypothetical protein